jgi:hypothetical protein
LSILALIDKPFDNLDIPHNGFDASIESSSAPMSLTSSSAVFLAIASPSVR